jgi:hypothetical protein
MHDVAVLRISSENVRNDLAECFWENAFVDVLDSVVDVLFRSRYATLHVPLVAHNRSLIYFERKDTKKDVF